MDSEITKDLLSLTKADPLESDVALAVAKFLHDPSFNNHQTFSNQSIRIVEHKTFNYLYVSDSIEQLTGFSKEEFKNGGLRFAYKHTHPLDLLLLPWLTLQSHRALEKLDHNEKLRSRLSYDIRFRSKKGKYIRVLQHVHVLALSAEGKPSILMFISSDITPYKTNLLMNYNFSVNRDGVFETILEGARQTENELLTSRELEVLRWTAEGLTEKEIADRLSISAETVKVHRKNMLNKTGKKNAVELVRYALANSWL